MLKELFSSLERGAAARSRLGVTGLRHLPAGQEQDKPPQVREEEASEARLELFCAPDCWVFAVNFMSCYSVRLMVVFVGSSI